MAKNLFEYVTERDITIQRIQLERFAATQHHGMLYGGHTVRHQLFAACIKRKVECTYPIKERIEYGEYRLPATRLDTLKSWLPPSLQFGWLTPRYQKFKYETTHTHEISLHNFDFIVGPENHQYINIVKDVNPPQKLVDYVHHFQREDK